MQCMPGTINEIRRPNKQQVHKKRAMMKNPLKQLIDESMM